MSIEVKVGICFLAGLFLLAASTFVVTDGKPPWTKTGPEYSVYFEDIAGLGVGDPVLYGGFNVGEVVTVEVDPQASLAKVTFQIEPAQAKFVKIHNDSEHRIGADLFGRARLEIAFGTHESGVIGPDQPSPKGVNPTNLGQMMDSAGQVLDETKGLPTEVKKLTISLNENQEKVLMEFLQILQENRPNIKRIIDRIADISVALSTAKGTIGKLIKEDGLYKKTDTFMDKANVIGTRFGTTGKIVNEILGENRTNIKKVTDNLADASPHLSRGLKTINEIMDENRETVKRILDDVEDITPKINKSMADVNVITDQMAKGRGTIGNLLMNEDMAATVTKTIKGIDTAATEITKFASGANDLKTYLGLDFRAMPQDQSSRANIFLKLQPAANKEYYLGGTFYINYDEPEIATDLEWREAAFDQMSFNILLGWRFWEQRLTFKVGALESVIGGIFEYNFNYGLREDPSKAFQVTTLGIEARAMDKDYEDWETEIMMRA
ncbi:MlaD family protein, partial [Planctomycetota bacterium]